jgi:propanol-preferring alcohol dehydrogenase
MKAMLLTALTRLDGNTSPLAAADVPDPVPGPGQLLLEVSACGVCHTEIDEIEGRTPPSGLPRVLGHQVVGRVIEMGPGPGAPRASADGAPGPNGDQFHVGDRAGVAWIYSACGQCACCVEGCENLCPDFRATGRDEDGGYAQLMVVGSAFAYRIPEVFSDVEAAPLLCAGAIGYRSVMLTGLRDGDALGLTGFGASAHLVLMMVRHRFPRSRVFVFTRSGEERAFARDLGAAWAGDTTERSPETLQAIIDTTPAWKPVVEALANLRPGGRLVINAIRKEDGDKDALLRLDYPTHLWMEKQIMSVANVTRRDVREFLQLASEIPIRPEVEAYPLSEANRALQDIKQRRIRGAKVLTVS